VGGGERGRGRRVIASGVAILSDKNICEKIVTIFSSHAFSASCLMITRILLLVWLFDVTVLKVR
jgi:hypothetical protein